MYASKLHRCKFLLQSTNHFIIKSRFLSSFHTFYSPNCSVVNSTFKKVQETSNVIIVLTPKCVNSTLKNCPSDLIALSFFLWCARQPGYFHDKFTFHGMVDVVGRLTQRFLSVKQIIRQLQCVGFVKKPQALLILLRIYWCGGVDYYKFVFEAFDEMNEDGYTPNTFARNIVMDVMFKIGHASEALRFLNETRVLNFLSFSIAVCNLCKLDDIDNVRNVLRIMLRKGYYLTTELISVVLNCYCKLGRLNEALQLLGFMVTSGIPISVYIRSILVDGFCRSGRLVTASSLLENMVRAGFLLDVVTCTSLIRGFMKTGNLFMASSLFKKLKQQGCSPDLVLYNVLIDCLSKAGRYDDALAVFFSLPKRKLTPDSYTYCSITSAITLSRKFSLLPSVIGGHSVKADLAVFNSLVNYFCKAGCPSHAVELYNLLVDEDYVPDRYTYAGLLIGLCGLEKSIDVAVNVYHGIIRSQFVVDAHIHTIIVNGLIKSGSINKGIKLLEAAAVENYPLDVVAYTVAIRALLRVGSSAAACRLYEQMKRHGVIPNANVCKVLLYSLCKVRDFLMLKKILQDMVDAKILLDENTFSMIQRYSFRSEHLPSILNILNELSDSKLIQQKAYIVT